MLRKVTAESVTVWIALRKSAAVTLEVRATHALTDPTLVASTMSTTKIGPRLHIVAVTATLATSLANGTTYFYHLAFQTGTESMQLSAAIGGSVATILAYPPYQLPSFSLPPADLPRLRIIHGSCRKPNGEKPDALPILNNLIAQSVESPLDRPHQLIMSGDQIYADEVADILLMMLTEAGETLIGPDGIPSTMGSEIPPSLLWPTSREQMIYDAGFTTVDRRSHLMSLGEFLAMYLFVWSDVLWPPTMPDVADLMVLLDDGGDEHVWKAADKKRDWMTAHFERVLVFAETVGDVRRALANVPTYMIFDDHDVTDDWNMYQTFCDQVYSGPIGVRVVQNALCAYALCQHWGNAPEQFRSGPLFDPAGKQLLDLFDGASSYDDLAANLALLAILGIHKSIQLFDHAHTNPPYAVFHEQGTRAFVGGGWTDSLSLLYHYTIEGPAHQVIVADSRTWRSFPRTSGWAAPDLIAAPIILDQIGNALAANGRQVMLVMTTNIAPAPALRQGARDLPIKPLLRSKYRLEDMSDAWEPERIDFSRLLAALARHVGRAGSVVVLSGDVHTSSAARIQYWADSQLDEPGPPTPAQLVVAQLVGSPFHNGNKDTEGQHRRGYEFVPNVAATVLKQVVAREEHFVGWSPLEVSDGLQIGEEWYNDGYDETARPARFNSDRPLRTLRHEYIFGTELEIKSITTPPTYRVLLNYMTAVIGSHYKATPPAFTPAVPPMSAWNNASAAFQFSALAGAGSEIVGRSNVGEVRFGNDIVSYFVHWRERAVTKWVRFDVSLDLTGYDKFRYPGEPTP